MKNFDEKKWEEIEVHCCPRFYKGCCPWDRVYQESLETNGNNFPTTSFPFGIIERVSDLKD